MSEREMSDIARRWRPMSPVDAASIRPAGPGVQRDAVDGVTCRVGDSACAGAHAKKLARSADRGRDGRARSLLQLQRQYGNRYVGRVLARAQASEAGGGDLESAERSIDQARGGGQGLDHSMRKQMESAFGADFGGVRVHTDSRADGLNRSLSARAFATGHDIFFRQGEYQPGSTQGRELIAHELTHVVQQNGTGIQAKMSVSEPDDPQEIEADKMARAVMQREHESASGTTGGGLLGRQFDGIDEKDEDKKKLAS
ncbi:MAG: DUF4157 domain-containing protein [Burkholderiaceae bacterium]